MRIESAPVYHVGQRVLLTLKKGPAGYWRTHGWIQGRFTVLRNQATEEDVVRFDKGLEYVTSTHFGKARTAELDEFCEKMVELVKVAAEKAKKIAADEPKSGADGEEGR